MKYLFAVLFLATSFSIKAQIPIIQSNVTDDFKNKSLVYNAFKGKYDFLIAYHIQGGTKFGSTNVQIIVLKGKKWKKIIFNYKDNNELDQKVTKRRLDKKLGLQLIETLNSEKFWSLDNDSINVRRIKPKPQILPKQSKDTVYITGYKPVINLEVLDGADYFLQIIQNDKMRFYKTDNPDSYFKFYPQLKQRGNFIRSRDALIAAFGINLNK
jgi:hypothetical protein